MSKTKIMIIIPLLLLLVSMPLLGACTKEVVKEVEKEVPNYWSVSTATPTSKSHKTLAIL